MAKTKYKFNPETLRYEKFQRSRMDIFIRSFGMISAFLLGGFFLYYIVFTYYLDTPEEKKLKRENENYALHLELLNSKFENVEKIIADLEYRDINIYRTIFEAEPIPASIRNAGYGGVAKYASLEGYSNSKLIIESTKRLDKIYRQLYVLSKSFEEVSKLAENKEQMLAAIPAIQPVSNKDLKRIASGFGWRLHPIYKVRKFHDGLDFTGNRGTDIFATGDGTVVEVDYSRRGYGNKIVIDHGYGYKTLYAHLSKFNVRKGQKIKRGEKIGEMGSTGLSTAPHLHYEVWYKGEKVNPINFFHNDLTPNEYEKVLFMAEQANQALD